jgi:polysaccharide pyruvyl transferase WcaK-like protein
MARIVLFDDILERHVRRSLHRALMELGHDVVATPPIYHGHDAPREPDDVAKVRGAIDEVLAQPPDALINFRAANLTPDMLFDLRRAGILTLVWLHDDPVLYKICYGAVVDHYDIVLNCGNEPVLDFYQKKHGIAGVNFPFWTDNNEFPRTHDPHVAADYDLVFLGHFKGQVRSARYDILAGLPAAVRAFGRMDSDPAGIGGGVLEQEAEIAEALGKGRIGFNIPQIFADYAGHRYAFEGLARLGSFEFPSRVVQYAAVGLPVLTYGRFRPPDTFPEMLTAANVPALHDLVRRTLAEPEALAERAEATANRFNASFSALARAKFLERIIAAPETVLEASLEDRARMFAEPSGDDSVVPPDPGELPSIAEQIESLKQQVLTAPLKYRILHLGATTRSVTDATASHLRALRNLGHHVTHIEVGEGNNLLVRPPGMVAGAKESLIAPEALLSIAQEARADIVIFNGVGLGLHSSMSEDLKKAGLILIGIAASNEPIPAAHAACFDLFFTGSLEALAAYKASGVVQAAELPQAADIGWALKDLWAEPKFDADIVCLQDADGRTELVEVMDQIREQFESVRLHGAGWPDTSGTALDGLDLLSASRAGLIHVAFAGEGAPATALSWQVLLAIASGGVAVAPRSDGIAACFEEDEEILLYDSAEELLTRIRVLLANPDERERIRRRAFRKLVSEHLYEHRWNAVLAHLNTALGEPSAVFDEERRKGLGEAVRVLENPSLGVLISGYYGHRNLGDELTLKALTDIAAERRPELHFTVATVKTGSTGKANHFEAVSLGDVEALATVTPYVAATILGGGGLWHDYSFERAGGTAAMFSGSMQTLGAYARPNLMATTAGAPLYVYGLGVGPLGNDAAQAVAKFIGSNAASITVRDPESEELLRQIRGWTGDIEYIPDMVYAADLGQLTPVPQIDDLAAGLPVLALNLRPWAFGDMEAVVSRLAAALRRVVTQHPHAIVGLPMQEGRKMDAQAIQALFDALPADIPRDIIDWRGDPALAVNVIRRSDVVVAMRLHACLLAHRLGVPAVGLSYDPKVRGHFHETGRADFLATLEDGATRLAALIAHAASEDGAVGAETAALLRDLQQQARSGIESLVDRIPTEPRKRITFEFGTAKPAEQTRGVGLLDTAEIIGRAGEDGSTPSVSSERLHGKVRFRLDERAPHAGSAAVCTLQTSGPSRHPRRHLHLELRSTYLRPKSAKWLRYRVVADGVEILTEGIGLSKDYNVIDVYFSDSTRVPDVTVEIVAMQDCKDWAWNNAVALEISSAELLPTSYRGPTRVSATSEATQISGESPDIR